METRFNGLKEERRREKGGSEMEKKRARGERRGGTLPHQLDIRKIGTGGGGHPRIWSREKTTLIF